MPDQFRSSRRSAKSILVAVTAVLAVFLAGCEGVRVTPSQVSVDPAPVIERNITRTVEERPVIKTGTGMPVPTDVEKTLPALAVTSTPTWILEPLSTALEIKDLKVSLLSGSPLEDTPDQTCTYSLDGLFTCEVPEGGYRAIRISFTIERHEYLTPKDFESAMSQALMVIYPYKTVSRYTIEPPVGRADIMDDHNGVYHADFQLDSPFAAFTFYILVDGTSMAGSNLFLK
jgi:hypothetical protein